MRSSRAAVSSNEARRSLKIRRIRADEGLALRALRLAALADSPMAYGSTFAREDAYPEAVWHERAAAGAAGGNVVTIVAEHEGRLVAMASGLGSGPETQDGSQPTMVGVFVEGRARRQGIGVALIETIVGWARARGSTRLTVWITANNEPAHALYRRCGFHLTGATKPNAHTPTLPELEMARNFGQRTGLGRVQG
jgi:GNAT superfamily N-acetyltransferase